MVCNNKNKWEYKVCTCIYFYEIEKEAALNQYNVIRCKGAGVNEMGLAAGGANAHYSGRDLLPDGPASDAEQQTWRPCECGWIEDTISTVSTSISRQTQALPRFHQLEQNYPNPFNSRTTISYELTENSTIELAIFNQLG